MKKIVKQLNFCYYGFFVLAVLVAALMYYLVVNVGIQTFDPMSAFGKTLQTVVIIYTLCSVAGGLYLFKRATNKLKLIEDEETKLRLYRTYSIVRLCFIGLGVSLGVVAFYILGGYKSMIMCAAVSAIGLYFCKPMEGKIRVEIYSEDEQ